MNPLRAALAARFSTRDVQLTAVALAGLIAGCLFLFVLLPWVEWKTPSAEDLFAQTDAGDFLLEQDAKVTPLPSAPSEGSYMFSYALRAPLDLGKFDAAMLELAARSGWRAGQRSALGLAFTRERGSGHVEAYVEYRVDARTVLVRLHY